MADAEDQAVDEDAIPENPWTVARLNDEIKSVLAASSDRFPTYVVGEISEVNSYDYGTFFSLRDLDQDAVISCLAWSSAVPSFDHEFEAVGSAVVEASIDFHAEKGSCQLVVSDYWPLGVSARQQALADGYKHLRRATVENRRRPRGRTGRASPGRPPKGPLVGEARRVASLWASVRGDGCVAVSLNALMNAIYATTFDETHRDGTDLTERTFPECDGALSADQHETVCTDCGLVVEGDRIDRGPGVAVIRGRRGRSRTDGRAADGSAPRPGLSTW